MRRALRLGTGAAVVLLLLGVPGSGLTTPSPPANPFGEKPAAADVPALPPAALSATQIAPFLDILRLTPEQWAGAVSAAMEGTRLVYGPMTPPQTKSFEAKWAPMFDFPFKEGVDWLNKLNPLLGQFLAIRAAMADTAIQFDGAWKEAVTAAAFHDEQGAREALSIAFMEKEMLAGLKKQLDQVVKDILALGDPPNPQYYRHKKLEEHNDAIKETKEIIRQGKGAGTAKKAAPSSQKGRWVLTRAFSTQVIDPGNDKLKYKMEGGKAACDLNSATVSGTLTIRPAMTKMLDYPVSAAWKTSWTTPPGILADEGSPVEMTFAVELTSNKGFDTEAGHMHIGPSTGVQITLSGGRGSETEPGGVQAEFADDNPDHRVDIRFDGASKRPEEHSKQTRNFATNTKWLFGPSHETQYLGVRTSFALNSSGPGGGAIVTRWYQYDWDPTGDSLKPIEGGAVDAGAKSSEIRPRTPEELAEEIGFYLDTIKLIQANMAKDQAELGQTADGDRRAVLVNRIIIAQANIQAEQDRITTLQTGEIVHTRTAWDEMQNARFIQYCQEEVNEMAARDRLRVGSLRMAGRAADPEQAKRLRKFVLDQADPAADSTKLKRIADAVYNQVQGELEAKAARSQEEAIGAAESLAYAESVKHTCDEMLFVGALLGGHPVMVAYQGAIGFLEGPPPNPPKPGQPEPPTDPGLGDRIFEGVKRAGAWYNTATFVAAEALDGYEKGGYIGGNESKGTFWGAAERAAEAFLMAKAFEYAAGKVFGKPPGAGGASARPTVQEQFELAKYRQECEWAKGLVEDYKRTFAEYRKIQEFGASAAEMASLEKQLQQKAASIHASFEGKLYLKAIHGQGKDAAMLEDFVFRMGKNHEAVREAWLRKMEAMGYDDVRHWKTIEFRNSASAGSPGMDHDMGIWDKGEKFFKDRLRVNTHAMNQDAQKAWEKAYQETTGYSARQSFENITTSLHVEAYRDLAWIGDASIKHAKVDEILSAWAGQAADVTAVKNYDMFKNLGRLQAVVESGRGMAKDIQTKLLPMLEEGALKFPKSAPRIKGGVDPATGKRLTGLIEKWSQISDILKAAADNPVEADRKIRMLTGKSICELTSDLRDIMAIFGQAIGK